MDNHAGNFNIKDLKWLGGMIDSDGCIGISSSKRKHGNVVYTPSIIITNSSTIILDKCHEVLLNNNINHHIKPNQSCKNIVVSRPTVIVKFFDLMKYNILTKMSEFKLINKYCLCRIHNVKQYGCNWKAKYTEEELTIVEQLKQLNKKHYGECIEYGISETHPNIEAVSLFSLDWLAGFIDGDGCLTINKVRRPNGNFQYQPLVSIVTGSPLSKTIISTYLDRYNVDYYLRKKLPGVKHKSNCICKTFEFSIRNIASCIKLLNITVNKMNGKKNRGLKLKEFCESRLINKNKPYSIYEKSLHDYIKKDIRDTSTTKNKTPYGEDIV